MSMIDSLNWRYATTKFDNSKAVSEQHVNDLKEIIRLTPASWGFQFYKVLVISNNDLKAKLLPAAYNQSQIVDCSHLFVICSFKEVLNFDSCHILNRDKFKFGIIFYQFLCFFLAFFWVVQNDIFFLN